MRELMEKSKRLACKLLREQREEEMRTHTPQFARQRSKREKEELGRDRENQSQRE